MNAIIKISAFLLFVVQAKAEVPTNGYINISPSQRVAYDLSIVDAKKPTLVLLPGIYRGLNRNDEFIKVLLNKKINFVTVNFSTQPLSVANYDANQDTYFKGGKNVTSKIFADEVETLVDVLKIKKPLVVTLSYSGSVTQYLNANKFPVVIETSPIGRFDESDPELAAVTKAWEDWFKLFPIWGDAYIQNAKDAAYRNYWNKTALDYSKSDARLQTDENILRMTDGFVGMAKAVEKFDMREQNFKSSPHRVFIFGENEEQKRKEIQLEAVEIYNKQTGLNAQPIIIKGAGHIVPNDQPAPYVEYLSAFLDAYDKK